MDSTDRVVLAVDGGQSHVRVRASDATEPVVVPGVSRLEGDTAAALVARIVEARGLLGADGGRRVARLVLGLTTLPADAEGCEALVLALRGALPVDEVWLASDAVTAHAGALPERHGVVLTVGTGVACLGLDRASGRSARVNGDGFLLGDAGGAFWIGSRGLAAVLRARDGRGPATALDGAADAAFGVHEDLAAHVHSLPRAVNAVAQFAVQVQAVADDGDEAAAGVVDAAALELLTTVTAAARVVAAGPVPLAVSGRVAAPGTALRRSLERHLAASGAPLSLVAAAGSPLDGAFALARGAGPDPYTRLITAWSAP